MPLEHGRILGIDWSGETFGRGCTPIHVSHTCFASRHAGSKPNDGVGLNNS